MRSCSWFFDDRFFLLFTFYFFTFDLISSNHARIHTIVRKQFAMRALFDDAALVEDDDLVGLEDGVEAVGDGEDGAALH